VTASVRTVGMVDSSVLGVYGLTYSVSDHAGNNAYARREVVVADLVAPVITLIGSDHATVECHTGFADAGVTAMDDHDGDLASSVMVSGVIDTGSCGTYVIDYAVSDAAGNIARAQRVVDVVDTIAPMITASVAIPRLMAAKGQMVNVGLSYRTSDACGPVSVSISVTQEDATGNDIDAGVSRDADGAISGLFLRAQDGSRLDGRVYLIILTATDSHGNTSDSKLVVTVPHSNGKKPMERADARAQAILAAGVPLAYDSFGLMPSSNG
jgi:hypothetical protein